MTRQEAIETLTRFRNSRGLIFYKKDRLMHAIDIILSEDFKAKENQRLGIEKARREGKHIGRPKFEMDSAFINQVILHDEGKSLSKCSEDLGISINTFRKYYRKFKEI